MKIALASPPFPSSVDDAFYCLEDLVKQAAVSQAEIICFPESYIPGYPGMNNHSANRTPENLQSALERVCEIAAKYSISIIIPMDWPRGDAFLNVAFVVSRKGEILGYQSKNQLDPSEDSFWIPGTDRKVFEVNGTKFGITICHEGFRYPESVRWAATHGAQIVFHPHFTGSNETGNQLIKWGDRENPYYEKAMMMRALENTIFFASSNYSSLYSESASSVIGPDGQCIIHEMYGRSGIIVADINVPDATGLLAKRFNQDLYR